MAFQPVLIATAWRSVRKFQSGQTKKPAHVAQLRTKTSALPIEIHR
jgi:heme-degrading monooxygenase HmoA